MSSSDDQSRICVRPCRGRIRKEGEHVRNSHEMGQRCQQAGLATLGAVFVVLFCAVNQDLWNWSAIQQRYMQLRVPAAKEPLLALGRMSAFDEDAHEHGVWMCPPQTRRDLEEWLAGEVQFSTRTQSKMISQQLAARGITGRALSELAGPSPELYKLWQSQTEDKALARIVAWSAQSSAKPTPSRVQRVGKQLMHALDTSIAHIGDRKRLALAVSRLGWYAAVQKYLEGSSLGNGAPELQAAGSSQALLVWFSICSRPYAGSLAPLARDPIVVKLIEARRVMPALIGGGLESSGDALRLHVIEHVYGLTHERAHGATVELRIDDPTRLLVLDEVCRVAARRLTGASAHPACSEKLRETKAAIEAGKRQTHEALRSDAERVARHERIDAVASQPVTSAGRAGLPGSHGYSASGPWVPRQGQKFVYYGVNYGRFNNQLVSMLKGLVLARELGRTAVMPMFFDGNDPGVRWLQLFGPEIFQHFDIVNHTNFLHHFTHVETAKWAASDVVCLSDGLNGGIIPPEVQQVESLGVRCDWVQVDHSILLSEGSLDRWLAGNSRVQSSRLLFIMFPYYWPKDYSKAMGYLTPAPHIEAEVKRFLESQALLGTNYTGVHSRTLEGGCRGVYNEPRWQRRYSSGERLAKQELCNMRWETIQTIREQYVDSWPGVSSSNKFILASDGQSKENDEDLRRRGAVQYQGHFLTDPIPPSTVFYAILVDWWLLVHSYIFIGNPVSSFSANVCLLRRTQGRLGVTHPPEMCDFWKVLEV